MQVTDTDQIVFGDFRLDLKHRVLERNGQFVRLPPKALDTLTHLIRAHPGMLSREELHSKLWPDCVVEDGNLAQHVYVLRKALGAGGNGHPYIETVARRGYRFVGELNVISAIEPVTAPAPPHAAVASAVSRRGHRVALVAVALGVLTLAVILLGGANLASYRPHPEALRLYQEGRALWRQRKASTQEVERCFREALAIDPKFTAAQIGLADTLATRPYPAQDAQTLISKILAENDGSAEAHATAGFIRMFQQWDWDGARRHFERSIELDPKYPWARQWYAVWNSAHGRHDEAEAQMRAVFAADPTSVNLLTARCWSAYLRGNTAEAMNACQEALKIDPLFSQAHEWLIRISSQLRDANLLLSSLGEFGDYTNALDSGYRMEIYKRAYNAGGIEGLWRERLKQTHASGYFSAELHALLGAREDALRELERACDQHEFYMIFVAVEPAFRSLHGEARFQKVCARVGLKA